MPLTWRRVVTVLLPLLSVGAGTASPQDVRPEYQLKAAFVLKFAEFSEWPASALGGKKTFDVCVARPNPFGRSLDDLIDGDELQGHTVVARVIGDPAAVETCHVLFVSAAAGVDGKRLLARAARLPVLTVGDYDGFLDDGGIVNLRLVNGRVRFDVNVGAANRAGLRLSSQLLRLAMNVRGGPS